MPTFQYTIIKMIIVCACRNLLNNKKKLKGHQNRCVKRPRKIFSGRKSSSKLTLKTKWYHSCGCYDDSKCFEQLKMRATDRYFEKKLDFEY